MEKHEEEASVIVFKILTIVLCLLIIGGVGVMCFTAEYSLWLSFLLHGVGFLLKVLLTTYYLSEKKSRAYIFALLAIVLGLTLLDKIMAVL